MSDVAAPSPVAGSASHRRGRSFPRHLKRRSRRAGAIEWVAIVVVALLAALALKTYVVEAYYIPSQSMTPTIKVGDRVLVDKLAYDFTSVHRGDIVVFTRPPADPDTSIKDLIKRVIGLPGERISSGPRGEILIDGRPIAQPWLTADAEASPGPAVTPMTIPKGEYFVMGDDRGDSEDSRYFGPIRGSSIVGKAFVRVWPLSRLHWF